jgi:hypothetical protein
MKYLDDYMHFAGGNEAPKIYHLWSALSALSATIGKRVRFDLGYFPILTNMYVVLVGSPGIAKTTAMNIAKNLVRDMNDIPICADAVTREKLVQMIAQKDSPCKKVCKLPDGKIFEFSQMSIFASELVHFLGANATNMVDFLTNIWDEDRMYENKTKNKGEDDIPQPYITLLGCMTPEITTSYLKQSIITGGFTRRAIFVLAHRRGDPIAIPEITQSQREARTRCLAWLSMLRNISGHVSWEQTTRDLWKKWYDSYRLDTNRITDPATMGYFESKSTQVLKLAVLLGLAESTELVLRWRHIEFALELLKDVEVNLSQVFLGVGRNESAPLAAKIMGYLEITNEAATKKRLYSVFFNDAPHGREDIDKVILHLVDTNQIRTAKIENKTTGASYSIYGTDDSITAARRKLEDR